MKIPLPFGKQIWGKKEEKMADNLGPTPVHNIDSHYLLRKQFSVAIEATIFRIDRRAIEVQRLQSIFTLSLFI